VDRGYVPRQLCLQALRYSMGELADTARRRLTSVPDPNLCPRWTTVVTRPPALELGADDVWVTPVAVLSDGDVITGNALGLVRRWRTDQPGVPAELGCWYRRALAGCHRLGSGLVRPRKDTHCLRSSSDRWAGKCGGKCGVSASDRLCVGDVHGCVDSFRVSDLRHA
jgi:hypothetical protein